MRTPALHPQAAALLAGAPDRPNAHLLSVAAARTRFEADRAGAEPREPVAAVVDLRIDVEGGAIPARAYRPAAGPLGAIVYLHGGGWLLGSVDSHDVPCRALANAAGAVVVSVGYRRGPERRFPTAARDAYAATRWVAEHAGELVVDPARLAVAGDSAGGNLAIAATLLARDAGHPALAFQLLVYPVTTTDLDTGFDAAWEGVVLYRDELRWHQDNYLATAADRGAPLVSPLDGADLRGLPPALVVTAGCDPLHPQGERYADALRAAGVPVEHLDYPGMTHGFFERPATLDDARDAMRRTGDAVRAALDPPHSGRAIGVPASVPSSTR